MKSSNTAFEPTIVLCLLNEVKRQHTGSERKRSNVLELISGQIDSGKG